MWEGRRHAGCEGGERGGHMTDDAGAAARPSPRGAAECGGGDDNNADTAPM